MLVFTSLRDATWRLAKRRKPRSPVARSLATRRALNSLSVAALLGAVSLLCAVATGCTKHPPSIPLVSVYNRSTARLEVATIVVSDPQRGARIRQLYLEMAQTVESLAATRSSILGHVQELTLSEDLNESEIRAQIDVLQKKQAEALEQYIDRQLELRKLTTEKEFKRLGAFK